MDLETRRGIRLKELRLASSLTQEELSARAGLSVDKLSAIERGREQGANPRIDTLTGLATAFGMRLHLFLELLDDPDDSPRQSLIREIRTQCETLDERHLTLVRDQVAAVVRFGR